MHCTQILQLIIKSDLKKEHFYYVSGISYLLAKLCSLQSYNKRLSYIIYTMKYVRMQMGNLATLYNKAQWKLGHGLIITHINFYVMI